MRLLYFCTHAVDFIYTFPMLEHNDNAHSLTVHLRSTNDNCSVFMLLCHFISRQYYLLHMILLYFIILTSI